MLDERRILFARRCRFRPEPNDNKAIGVVPAAGAAGDRATRRGTMRRRTLVAGIAAGGLSRGAFGRGVAQTDGDETLQASDGGAAVANEAAETGYAPVNGLRMYYAIHGAGEPLVLLHGAYGTASMWGGFVPTLAKTYRVIVPELQGHGHTADIDRPIRYDAMADDIAGLLGHLGLARADIFGYSMGGGVALRLAIRHPELVRKLVVASASSTEEAIYPEVLAGIQEISPEIFAGTPFYEDYARVAPEPDAFPRLVDKLKDLDAQPFAWPAAAVAAIAAPTMIVMGDADIIRPEHAVELFRLRGGGVPGDLTGLPGARLAILPGTTHIGVMQRPGWLLPMIEEFLAVPTAEDA
jgi:pimeloyl-ACP methyl ester carboxylesterase